MLADLYGPQRLLHEGLLPPELVLANPGFLRPCHGVRVPGDCCLHLYAADLARAPDGQWWVLGDRTQAPSGAGYALENRIVVSRIAARGVPRLPRASGSPVLPGAARHAARARAAPAATTRASCCSRRAPTTRPTSSTPTSRATSATRWSRAPTSPCATTRLPEDARRARAGRRDPAPPGRRVLRSARAARRFGRSASAGLVQAVRAGNVAVANALGSGLVETPALLAFLPGLCRALLGEELRCRRSRPGGAASQAARDYVIEHLDELVIKPAFPSARGEPVFGGELSADDARGAARRGSARAPHAFVGAGAGGALDGADLGRRAREPRHVVLRVFAARAAMATR